MTDLPDVKIKALVVFPAVVNGGTGIEITKTNGAFTVDIDYSEFAQFGSAPPNAQTLMWDSVANVYTLVPPSAIGGISDSPSDNKTYGRNNRVWVDAWASPVLTGNPTAPTPAPGDNGNSVATTAFVSAAIAVPATALPLVESGSGAIGTSVKYAREDHVHPLGPGGGGGFSDEFRVEDYPSIQAAIDAAAAARGGVVRLQAANYDISATLLITNSDVRLRGVGSSMPHNAGVGGVPATSIRWVGAAGGTMLRIRTPSAATSTIITGCGVERLSFNGNGLAATAMEIISIRQAAFSQIFVTNVTGRGILLNSGTINVDAAEAPDTQRCTFDNISWRMIDSVAVQSAHAFELSGSATGNASFNTFLECGGQVHNGTAFRLINADNNEFHHCGSQITGSGLIWDFLSPSTNGGIGTGAVGNHLYSCGTGLSTQSTIRVGATNNVFIAPDIENGSQVPTADVNAKFIWLAAYPQFKLGRYVEITQDTTNEAAVYKANASSSGPLRLQLSGNDVRVGTDILNPALMVAHSTAGAGLEVLTTGAGSGVKLIALSSGTDESIQILPKGAGAVTVGTTTGGSTIIPKGVQVSGDWSTMATITSNGTKAIANGANAVIGGMPVVGLIIVANTTNTTMAMAWLAVGSPTIINQVGTEFVVGSAPAAGKTGIGFDGASSYRIYNNTGASKNYTLTLFNQA